MGLRPGRVYCEELIKLNHVHGGVSAFSMWGINIINCRILSYFIIFNIIFLSYYLVRIIFESQAVFLIIASLNGWMI